MRRIREVFAGYALDSQHLDGSAACFLSSGSFRDFVLFLFHALECLLFDIRALADLTSVIVGVFGPIEAGAKEELIDRATIQVNFQPAIAQSGGAQNANSWHPICGQHKFINIQQIFVSLFLFRIFVNSLQRL